MPAFGFLLVLVGVFVLINVFNGNLPGLFTGSTQLNFGPTQPGTPSNPIQISKTMTRVNA